LCAEALLNRTEMNARIHSAARCDLKKYLYPRAAYVHIPFCISKCRYCAFNSVVGDNSSYESYTAAVIREIEMSEVMPKPLETVYFGGGTPTVLGADRLLRIFDTLSNHLRVSRYAEITIEANPDTVNVDLLAALRKAGFNRLSVGIQSFDDNLLKVLGRTHNSAKAVQAVCDAKDCGFDNISIDLIYALPYQTPADWQHDLESAIEIEPKHISLYELSIEDGTPFAEFCASGELGLPCEDDQVEMYSIARHILADSSYEHYEISNFAMKGYRSRHNQVYWRNEAYYGFGAGASSYIGGVRATNHSDICTYMKLISTGMSAAAYVEKLDAKDALGETIMLGLRMLDGVSLKRLNERFGLRVEDLYSREISDFVERGLIDISDGCIKLTAPGLLLANEVAMAFMP